MAAWNARRLHYILLVTGFMALPSPCYTPLRPFIVDVYPPFPLRVGDVCHPCRACPVLCGFPDVFCTAVGVGGGNRFVLISDAKVRSICYIYKFFARKNDVFVVYLTSVSRFLGVWGVSLAFVSILLRICR